MDFLKRVGITPGPVAFGKYRMLGPEAVFAVTSVYTYAYFTNVISLGSFSPYFFSKESLEPEIPLNNSQILQIVVYNCTFIYLNILYFTMALCDPGRIESEKEKKFLRDRFDRLERELHE
jgi:hypothetical protein